jgi:hypothetical protein
MTIAKDLIRLRRGKKTRMAWVDVDKDYTSVCAFVRGAVPARAPLTLLDVKGAGG